MPPRAIDELPVDRALPEVLDSLCATGAVVISAAPGAGKTTRVPPALLDDARLLGPANPKVLLLQPRRVAARASAARIAYERGWTLGREVGYRVRFERRVCADTRLEVITEGILTRRLLDDPYLEGVGAVILDEFHERSVHTDLAIAMVREIREAVRDDLKLVVMSATLDAEPISRYLSGCPIIRVEGRTHPVETLYRPSPAGKRLEDQVRTALESLNDTERGHVLVFLPGMEEIRRASRAIEGLAEARGWLVLPLHGSLPAADQDRALQPSNQRKVVLATNVAETSLTIEGVTTVIDCGLARVAVYDSGRGLDRLELRRISKASAAQRAGRAGRTASGRCLRLWSERDERAMPPFEVPEIRRVDLSAILLLLDCWGHRDPSQFAWFEEPEVESIVDAQRLLQLLGALDDQKQITPLGRRLLTWPVSPRLGRLLEASVDAGMVEQGAALAAILGEKDLAVAERYERHGPAFSGSQRLLTDSDLLVRLDMLEEAQRASFRGSLRDRGIDPNAARKVAQARDDYLRLARREGLLEGRSGEEEDLLKLVLLAYPDRVCRRRCEGSPLGVMVGGRGVRLDATSTVRDAELFVAVDARTGSRTGAAGGEVLVKVASLVRADWLSDLFPAQVSRVQEARFDPQRQRVVGWTRWLYRDLVLREEPGAAVDRAESGRVLAEALADQATEIFNSHDEPAALLSRLTFLRATIPEQSLPAWDKADFIELLKAACSGCQAVSEITGTSLAALLRGCLSAHHRRLLELEAPETVEVPSGSRIRLKYEAERPPRISVRLQELFGWSEGPRLAQGRVAVVLELLGPNYRPVQVTDDLRSFWNTTYEQVRKDLRRRYPKHAWPEDPWTAKAEARGGRKPGR